MTRGTATTTDYTIRTDDGADLAVTDLPPLRSTTPVSNEPFPVVLVHGWAASRRVWGVVADRLVRSGHRVVCYDQREHGLSSGGREPISLQRLAADVAIVLDRTVGTDPAVLVAHSGGGFAALTHVCTVPEQANTRLGGLVLAATAAHGQDTPEREVRMMGSALFTRALARPGLGRRFLRRTMGKRVDPTVLDVNRQMFVATTPRVRAACFGSTMGMDLRPRLSSVRVPAVVLSGSVDRIVPSKLGWTVAQNLPDARFLELPDTGHMLPLEAPHQIVDSVTGLTARRESETTAP
ncbi:alpha/beta hydrolase [Lipingzhangella sp. LS1_29]|uniref:Alpha/beta hydrolase n=1 Tax=Lipingzhangella rawalii TaxID=2055835 RepID=A0ABU2HAV7_9ACTN|nr:alpha/beta hydrolase [Lipingzhangella rawalii]MDS1272456.1 alpha/beta hydrolase [Lipingzhangella rawalii]